MPDTAHCLVAGALFLSACSPQSCAPPAESSSPAAEASDSAGAVVQAVDGAGRDVARPHALPPSPTPSARGVFVSEFHYDNVGKDEGEAVELEGPSSADLRGHALHLYNGQNGEVYRRIDLDGHTSDEPGGRGTIVLRFASNGMQNGAPDGWALVGPGGELLEFLSYEGSFTATEGPAKGLTSEDIGAAEPGNTPLGSSLQRFGKAPREKWRLAPHSFGRVNAAAPPEEMALGSCGEEARAIAEVQGSGSSTPLAGQHLVVEGVVVGDFQDPRVELGGFFLQSLTPDADSQTSEGLFVHDEDLPTPLDLQLGERVRVAGTASEKGGMTRIVADALMSCGTGSLPTPVPLPLPFAHRDQLEAVEGMLVSAAALTVTDSYNLGRYGELSLSVGGRLFHPNNGPASSRGPNASRLILLDDGRRLQNPKSLAYLAEEGSVRLGDTLSELTAVVHEAFGHHRLQPLRRSELRFRRTQPRPARPDPVGGQLRIATLNVLNYFTRLGQRGADSALELERQRAKLVRALLGLNADVVGLVEMQNERGRRSPSADALDDLLGAVNAELGGKVYARAPDPVRTGSDAIRSAIIYKSARLKALPEGRSDRHPVHSRPPIAASFSVDGELFSVVVNHFKSKGGCPKSSRDPNADHGQGCWNLRRTQQAEALLDFVALLQKETRDPDVVVLGDFNSYLQEDPIVTLEKAGWVNPVAALPPETRYSYVYRGEAGLLDYAFVTPTLEVSGATIWHINADEARVLDYNTEFNPAGLYRRDAFRSSDHDPLLLGLRFRPASRER